MWISFTFLLCHFICRLIVSLAVIEFFIDPPNGTKETSLLLVFIWMCYTPIVGMNFRYMVAHMEDSHEFADNVLIVAAIVCAVANAFVDVAMNVWRKDAPLINEYFGNYLSKDDIGERFGLLHRLGIESPNYFFEILEWMFFALYAFRWEAFWWFVASTLIILPRNIWTAHWQSIPVEKPRDRFEWTSF